DGVTLVGHLRVPGRCAEKRHHDGLVGAQPTDQSLPRQRSTLHEAWVADVPDLAYCSAFGDTPHEAVNEVEVAVQVWLEAAESVGREVTRPSAHGILA
ncbi:MAG: type II toxin-antitoxin system HicB family antitoxin, partial [Acidimicrobiales bacterium]